jgi:hypothetical protein
MSNIITHQPWCTDHCPADGPTSPGQCCSTAVDVAPHVAVWLTRTEQGNRVIVDGPPAGVELTLHEAGELHAALAALRDAVLSTGDDDEARKRALQAGISRTRAYIEPATSPVVDTP